MKFKINLIIILFALLVTPIAFAEEDVKQSRSLEIQKFMNELRSIRSIDQRTRRSEWQNEISPSTLSQLRARRTALSIRLRQTGISNNEFRTNSVDKSSFCSIGQNH